MVHYVAPINTNMGEKSKRKRAEGREKRDSVNSQKRVKSRGGKQLVKKQTLQRSEVVSMLQKHSGQ